MSSNANGGPKGRRRVEAPVFEWRLGGLEPWQQSQRVVTVDLLKIAALETVSYTHLTLPTKRIV